MIRIVFSYLLLLVIVAWCFLDNPEILEIPEIPEILDNPESPESPEIPEIPEIPDSPDSPGYIESGLMPRLARRALSLATSSRRDAISCA